MTQSRSRRLRWLAPLWLTLALAGCAGRPTDVLIPVAATAPGTEKVSLLVATTRRATPDQPGMLFSGERSRRTSFGRVDVSIPPRHVVGDVEWPERSPGNPATDFVTTRVDAFDRAGFRTALRDASRRTGRHRVLLFVHGYNNLFDEAVFRFAQIAHDSSADALPVLFTWPSRGRLLAYPYDRESATYSRDALETLIADLAAEPEVSDIAVLAHSMGNWVTLEALRQASIRHGHVPEKVRNVMLAAPDVDVDVARTQLQSLGGKRPNITLFVSQDDRALQISQLLSGDRARLGMIDPSAEPYRTALERASINVIDLTKMNSDDPLNHAKFAASPEVVRSIGARLAGGQSIGTTRAGIGEGIGTVLTGTATAIGSAATVAVSVPLAVVDPETRSNLGENFRAVVPVGPDGSELATD